MIRENFTQLISTIGKTLTNSDSDTNNDYLVKTGRSNEVTIVLYGFIGIGNTNDTIDLTVNGTRFEIATGNQINMPIESITLNHTTSVSMSNSDAATRDISAGTSASNYNATAPGVLVFGYAISKTLF